MAAEWEMSGWDSGDWVAAEMVEEGFGIGVWEVLEAAEADETLGEQVLSLAANPINCTDSAAENFSNLEVAVEVSRARRLARRFRLD